MKHLIQETSKNYSSQDLAHQEQEVPFKVNPKCLKSNNDYKYFPSFCY